MGCGCTKVAPPRGEIFVGTIGERELPREIKPSPPTVMAIAVSLSSAGEVVTGKVTGRHYGPVRNGVALFMDRRDFEADKRFLVVRPDTLRLFA